MCGRTFCAIDPRGIQKSCEYTDPHTGKSVCPAWIDAPTGETYCPSYNIGPTIFTPVLVCGEHCSSDKSKERVIQPMRWGLIPQWHKGTRSTFKTMHNNCRGETITEKSTFATPFAKGKRCVVIAEGFYEWKTAGSKKTPYLFTTKDCKSDGSKENIESDQIKQSDVKESIKNEPENTPACNAKQEPSDMTTDLSKSQLLFMAGIFDICKEEGRQLYSYSILTTQAVGAVAEIHHRMPVILESELDIERWLNFQQYPSRKVKDLICSRDCLKSHVVTDKVNNVRYREADCILPLSNTKSEKLPKSDIRNWFTKGEPTKRKAEPFSHNSTSKVVKKESSSDLTTSKVVKKECSS